MRRLHGFVGHGEVVDANGLALGLIQKLQGACGNKAWPGLFVNLQVKPLAPAQVDNQRYGQAVDADAITPKHALGDARASTAEQFATLGGKVF